MAEEKVSEYHVCTEKTPYHSDMKIPCEHPDAFEITQMFYLNEIYGVYFCPYCQTRFHSIIPR